MQDFKLEGNWDGVQVVARSVTTVVEDLTQREVNAILLHPAPDSRTVLGTIPRKRSLTTPTQSRDPIGLNRILDFAKIRWWTPSKRLCRLGTAYFAGRICAGCT
jgi:hypothetical protein